MIKLIETSDIELVRSVFTAPEIWPYVCDDGTQDASMFKTPVADTVFYLVPMLDETPIGCLLIQEINIVTIELHTALFPAYAGKNTDIVFQLLIDFIKEEFPNISWLRTWVPSWNGRAMSAARRVGFELIGTERKAQQKNNELHDLHLFGVSLKCQ